MFVQSDAVYAQVLSLLESEMSDHAIARATGVPRSTVQRWRHTRRLSRPGVASDWRVGDAPAYAYVLGLYLGDGHVTGKPSSPLLRITLDRKYAGVVAEAAAGLAAAFDTPAVRTHDLPERGVAILQVGGQAMLAAFPQHGPGKKHERPIELAPWQRAITYAHPQMLLRGLIHSDGSRCLNRFSTRLPSGRVKQYEYVRYFFTNVSADIRRIFVEHCELLGIRCTQSNAKNISVAYRPSVELLDSFVGPKR